MFLQPTADILPRLHQLRVAAAQGRVEQHERHEQGKAGIGYPAVERFAAHQQQGVAQLPHVLPKAGERLVPRFQGEVLSVSRHVVGGIIVQPVAVEGAPQTAAHHHVEHVEDGKPLEEVVEVHSILQSGHEHDAHRGIRHPAAEQGQAERLDVELRGDAEVHQHDVGSEEASAHHAEADVGELLHTAHPHEREEATGEIARPHPRREGGIDQRVVAQPVFHEDLLHDVLRTEYHLVERHQQQDGFYLLETGEYAGRDVRMAHVRHAAQNEGEGDDGKSREPHHRIAVEPVVMLAIVQQECYLQQQCPPKHEARPVDAVERQVHEAEVAHHGGKYEQYDQLQPDNQPVHQLPAPYAAEPRREHVLCADGGEDDDVQHGEEHTEVALGRNPELDVRHTLERALNFGYPFYEADKPEQGQAGDVHRQQVGGNDGKSRCREQRLVGEAELRAEEHGKPQRHARQIGVDTHHHVFQHVAAVTDKFRQRTQVAPARQLEAAGYKHVYPRADGFGYPVAEHGHGKLGRRRGRMRCHQYFTSTSTL